MAVKVDFSIAVRMLLDFDRDLTESVDCFECIDFLIISESH
jgi:hypothetical protein